MNGMELTWPLILVATHLLAGCVTLALRRRPFFALLTGTGTASLIMLVLANLEREGLRATADLGSTWHIPGVNLTLQLHEAVIPELVFVHAVLAATCVLVLLLRGSADFLPGLLLLVAGYAALLMITTGPLALPFLYPLLLLPLTAWMPSGPGRYRPMLRKTILAPLLAIPCFVMANAILFRQMPLDPQNADFVTQVNVLLTIGLFLLCLPFPFYQLQQDESNRSFMLPTVVADLFYQFMVLIVLHGALRTHLPLREFEPLYAWLGWAAVITVVWSGFAAFGSRDPRQIWFYAAMLNWGMILLVFTLPLENNWNIILGLFLLRVVSLMACITSLTQLDISRLYADTGWMGLGNSLPWNMALFLFGALGLVGFPLSSSFGHFWITWQFIATINWQIAVVLAMGTVLTAIGLIRVLRILLLPTATTLPTPEFTLQRLQAASLLCLLVYFSFTPQAIDPLLVPLLARFQ